MDAKDLVIGERYLYEGRPVRLVRTRTRVFRTQAGDTTWAIIETVEYAFLWVKPEELEPCNDVLKEIEVC